MAAKAKIYQLKITLSDSNPPIWRRINVPATITLALLHEIVQVAMGWQNCHMYAFDYEEYSFGEVFPEDDNGMYPADKVRLNEVLTKVRDKMAYVYDMGDNWQHQLVLEKILPPADITPNCTHAAGACPPEDCGGLGGYYQLRQILLNPKDAGHARLKASLGGNFDPNFVDTAAINKKLAQL
jgi:hypothetical protein